LLKSGPKPHASVKAGYDTIGQYVSFGFGKDLQLIWRWPHAYKGEYRCIGRRSQKTEVWLY